MKVRVGKRKQKMINDIVCYASKCKYNDNTRNECMKEIICIKPNIDDAEPAYCDNYIDPFYEDEYDE